VNAAREYRVPLLIGAGTLVVALLLWVAFISPQNSKLSHLQSQQTQLQTQQTSLEAKLATLRTEQQKLSSSCADLQKISTQIPSVQNPTDIDAEESSFESQFNGLTASSGVTLTQFSGFAPATGTAGTPTTTPTTTPSSGAATPSGSGVTAVPTTVAVTGNYGQVLAFVNGLDSFPRLFVIQTFVLSYGATAASPSGTSSAGSSASSQASAASATAGAPPLWTGGVATPASAGPYSLTITGSIFYTSTPNALAACTRATADVKKG
jgi:Tfp pilus assembly protein PilO